MCRAIAGLSCALRVAASPRWAGSMPRLSWVSITVDARATASLAVIMPWRTAFENLNAVRQGMITASDAVARASTVIETHDKRGMLPAHRGEAATRSAQDNPAIARHILLHGHDEYYDAFRAYVEDPTGPGLQRAAGA